MERNVILAGVGGQGTIFAGQLLSKATLSMGYRVYLFEEHGMAQRGGSVATYFRMGDTIYTPLILEGTGDALIGFEPVEALRHLRYVKPSGTIILNTKRVVPVLTGSDRNQYPTINMIRSIVTKRFKNLTFLDVSSALEKIRSPHLVNTAMLGALCATNLLPISRRRMAETIRDSAPPATVKENAEAFDIGYEKFASLKKPPTKPK